MNTLLIILQLLTYQGYDVRVFPVVPEQDYQCGAFADTDATTVACLSGPQAHLFVYLPYRGTALGDVFDMFSRTHELILAPINPARRYPDYCTTLEDAEVTAVVCPRHSPREMEVFIGALPKKGITE
jgi:hypothetical protein